MSEFKDSIVVVHLFETLDQILLNHLRKLDQSLWNQQSLAGKWTVKQLVAHLLDGSLRTISVFRDGYFGENSKPINTYEDLIDLLNQMNADWIQATNRLSPSVLIDLLQAVSKDFILTFRSLDMEEKSPFAVAWAGEEVSNNGFHIAREYTEKWHHIQQIILASDPKNELLFGRDLYEPYLLTSIHAFPHHFRNINFFTNSSLEIQFVRDFTIDFSLIKRENNWELSKEKVFKPTARVIVPINLAWKIFSKVPLHPLEKGSILMEGDDKLTSHFLQTLAVLA